MGVPEKRQKKKTAAQPTSRFKQLLATVALVNDDENAVPGGLGSGQLLACLAASAQPLTTA